MAERDGNGVLRQLVQLLLPALLAFAGSWAGMRVQLATLEERVASIQREMQLQNEYNRLEHQRYEAADAAMAATLRDKR